MCIKALEELTHQNAQKALLALGVVMHSTPNSVEIQAVHCPTSVNPHDQGNLLCIVLSELSINIPDRQLKPGQKTFIFECLTKDITIICGKKSNHGYKY